MGQYLQCAQTNLVAGNIYYIRFIPIKTVYLKTINILVKNNLILCETQFEYSITVPNVFERKRQNKKKNRNVASATIFVHMHFSLCLNIVITCNF